MRRTISIKFFTFSMLGFLTISGIIVFFNFFYDYKNTIKTLIYKTLQEEVLNIRHVLKKSLNNGNLNNIVSYMDNININNDFINNLIIVDEKNNIVYSSSRKQVNLCKENSFDKGCLIQTFEIYKGFKPIKYKLMVMINTTYINYFIKNKFIIFVIEMIILIIIFGIFLWILINNLIVKPLLELKNFAYYANNEPKEFLISELESIRYSLLMTFKRLKRKQDELYKLSTLDPLTGLYNRSSLIEKVTYFISQSKRENKKFALVFLDLDDFKNVNDIYGHEKGDLLLKEIAKILKQNVRETDIVARVGGDEFIIIYPNIKSEVEVVNSLERIRKSFLNFNESYEKNYSITASMGVVFYPHDGEDFSTLLKNADIAMYKSKELGKNNYQFFTKELQNIVEKQNEIKEIIKEAILNDYFELYYQPKVNIKTKKIVGCEALLRLNHPIKGFIPPFEFIPIAEHSSMMIDIGDLVIKKAINQIKKWQNTPLRKLKISINLSPLQFKDKNLIDKIKNNIKEIDPSKLDIEITESVFIKDFENTLKIINEIKSLGITFSLDDFGTGFSSLSYLKNIAFDTLKIDKTFIDDIEIPKNKIFVSTIINIAKTLNMEIVAEGVENIVQLEILKELKCDVYQGYFCSKPLPVDIFEKKFKNLLCENIP